MNKFFYVLDLEWLTWTSISNINPSLRKKWQKKEIVQIGVFKVKINKNKFFVKKKLNIFIKPKYNKELPKYFVRLTGITQKIIDEKGLNFFQAMRYLKKFIFPKSYIITNGGDQKVLKYNCHLHNIDSKRFLSRYKFLNIRKKLRKIFKRRNLSTENLHNLFHFKKVKAHNAIIDCTIILKSLISLNNKYNYKIQKILY